MKQLFNLAIFTKKELMQLLVEEKRSSYRKGYKAGAAMRYRHTEKPIVTTDEAQPIPERQMAILMSKVPLVTTDGIPLEKVYCSDFTPPPEGMKFDHDTEGNLHVTYPITVDNPPMVYGDSLPVKESLTSEK